MQTTDTYVGLITSEHKTRPLFVEFVKMIVACSVDQQNLLASVSGRFDLDTVAGVQLDVIGEWVGFPRLVFVPGLGNVTLADPDYLTLLRAKILENHWDGGMESMQVILRSLFPGTPIVLYAVDNQDMSIDIYITGGTPSATQLALLKGGLLVPKPEGVRINGFILINGPLFGLDRQDAQVAGLDTGSFPLYL